MKQCFQALCLGRGNVKRIESYGSVSLEIFLILQEWYLTLYPIILNPSMNAVFLRIRAQHLQHLLIYTHNYHLKDLQESKCKKESNRPWSHINYSWKEWEGQFSNYPGDFNWRLVNHISIPFSPKSHPSYLLIQK